MCPTEIQGLETVQTRSRTHAWQEIIPEMAHTNAQFLSDLGVFFVNKSAKTGKTPTNHYAAKGEDPKQIRSTQ